MPAGSLRVPGRNSGRVLSSLLMKPNMEVPLENTSQQKRSRIDNAGNSSSFDAIKRADVVEKVSLGIDSIAAIAIDIRRMHSLMEKREKDREKKEMEKKEREQKNNIWNAIKETPNLNNGARYKAVAMVHKMGMKDAFLKMSPEERS